ncbi:DUF421 domain-containing protein [Pontibacter liquoris]|uniref:DUF421 domain-containing protein n=1 Tax=Pontibacter liquoris TaxID=2905677 RepID=UPI001FA7DE70|nr:YetF domain-containing protein [Pontibacter liquoris]
MDKLLFSSIESLERTLIIGLMAYLVLVIQLRISGKRTLSKMNSFDFIVTIALGSTLATVLLSKDVPLLDGIAAFALLIFLQYVITWGSVRSKKLSSLVKATPTLLLYQGTFLWDAMKTERITREEILAAIRSKGIGTVEEVGAVILETEGSISVIRELADGKESSVLQDVEKPAR